MWKPMLNPAKLIKPAWKLWGSYCLENALFVSTPLIMDCLFYVSAYKCPQIEGRILPTGVGPKVSPLSNLGCGLQYPQEFTFAWEWYPYEVSSSLEQYFQHGLSSLIFNLDKELGFFIAWQWKTVDKMFTGSFLATKAFYMLWVFLFPFTWKPISCTGSTELKTPTLCMLISITIYLFFQLWGLSTIKEDI